MGLWAVSAAKNGKEKPLVPGSSAFILDGVASNLRTTKDERQHIIEMFQPRVSDFNALVDGFNNSASFEDLELSLGSMYPPSELLLEDFHKSSSSIMRSYDFLETSSKPELLLEYSEKVEKSASAAPSVSTSAPSSRGKPGNEAEILKHHDESQSKTSSQTRLRLKSEFSEMLREPANDSIPLEEHPSPNQSPGSQRASQIGHQVSPETSQDNIVKREFMSHSSSLFVNQNRSPPMFETFGRSSNRAPEGFDARNEILQTGQGTLHSESKAPDIQIPPRKSSNLNRSTDFSDRDGLGFLSPIKLVNGRLPSAEFPAADLSFIPIMKTINAGFDSDRKPAQDLQLSESDKDANNSFQAIRTAIRKSFAGKTPRPESWGHPISRSDIPDDRNRNNGNGESPHSAPISNRISNEMSAKVKSEPGSDSVSPQRATSLGFKPSSEIHTRKESGYPIAPTLLNASLPYFKSGTGKKSNMDSYAHNGSLPIPSQLPEQRDLKRAGNSSNAVLQSNAEPLDTKDSNSSKFTGDISAHQPVNSSPRKVLAGSFLSSAMLSKQNLNPKLASPSKPDTALKSGKEKLGTTVAGSPVHRKNMSFKMSPSRGRDSESLFFNPTYSSMNSSRTPTKYSQQAERTSLRGSPTIFSIHSANETEKSSGKAVLHGSDKIGSKETKTNGVPVKKNPAKTSWVKTPLLPGNPLRREISHGSTSPRQPKPTNFGKLSHEATKRDLSKSVGTLKSAQSQQLHALKLPRVSKSPSKSGTNQSQVAHFNSRNIHDLKPVNHDNGYSKRLLASPEKRDRVKREKLQRSIVDEVKILSNLPDTQFPSRRRNGRNAVPLPDAARGIFRREHENPRTRIADAASMKITPLNHATSFVSDQKLPASSILPDIPSDDDALNSVKNLQSWASSPRLMQSLRETAQLDPKAIFGTCSDLDLNEVFESVKEA